jgi:hypothetical protein
LPLTAVGSNPIWDFGFFDVRKLSSWLRNIGGSTCVPFVPEIMHGRALEVFLYH